MPTMANITVKAANGTTDVVFTAVTASGGDNSPAVWRNEAYGGTFGQRPEFRLVTKPSGDKSSRQIDASFTFPALYTETTTGLTKVAKRANVRLNGSVPVEGLSDAQLGEFAAQFGNLVAAALIKASLATGYAPT